MKPIALLFVTSVVALDSSRRLSSDDYDKSKEPIADVNLIRLAISMALVLVLGSLAAGAGIGGGGLFVPLYWLVLGAGAKGAVPLSKATILGGAIGNFVAVGFMQHPNANRPLIDYEAATFMQSGELLGVIFGVVANLILPEIVIIVFLALVLSYNTRRTLKKGFQTRIQETQAKEECKEEVEDPPPPRAKKDPAVDRVLRDEATQFPLWAWGQLVPMTVFLFVHSYLKRHVFTPCAKWNLDERDGEPGGFAGGVFWLWYLLPVPVYAGFMCFTSIILKRRSARRHALGDAYPTLPNDLSWDDGMLRKFPTVSLLAGFTAGLLGIGGGMIIGPLFLEIGMEPQVGTSTCAFMILFTATSGVILYLFSGNLGWQLAVCCVFFGFISGQLGQHGVNWILKKTGRPSYVIFLLAGIVGSACAAMTMSGAHSVIMDLHHNRDIIYVGLSEFKCH